MSTTYFTSDLHFGHQKVARLRGFDSVDDHDADVLRSLNTLRPGDALWVLGDLCGGSLPAWERALRLLGGAPGRKRLVLGNHDPAHPMHRHFVKHSARLGEVFEWWGTDALVRFSPTLRARLSHFPYARDRGAPRYPEWRPANTGGWLVHGHTHGAERYTLVEGGAHEVHVGWDAWRRPVAQFELARLMEEASPSARSSDLEGLA
ncbi:MAG: metallophosphoesterase [Dermatophilaceae bacterium]